jgi:hypothetical protein
MKNDDNRPFPIQGGVRRDGKGGFARPIEHYAACTIPWWLAETAYAPAGLRPRRGPRPGAVIVQRYEQFTGKKAERIVAPPAEVTA